MPMKSFPTRGANTATSKYPTTSTYPTPSPKFSSPEQIRKTTPPHCSTNQTPSGQVFSCTAQRPKAKPFSLADSLTNNHQDDKWTIQPTDIADSNIVEIAGEIMAIGYAAMAGISIHTMGSAKNNTELETQHPSSIVRAANAIAYAGALARAAAVAEQFRAQPMI